MSNIDTLLNNELNDSKIVLTVNEQTRQVSHSGRLLLGTENDKETERLYFVVPRYVGDEIDLSTYQIYIDYENAVKEVGIYPCDDLAIEGDNVTFSWLLSRRVTEVKGTVNFRVCAKLSIEDVVENEWHSAIYSGEVLEGIDVSGELPEPTEYDTTVAVINGRLDVLEDSVKNIMAMFPYYYTAAQVEARIEEVAVIKSTEIKTTLMADRWHEGRYLLTVAGVTADSNQELLPAVGITSEQFNALINAAIADDGQAPNTVKLIAHGIVPTIDIPLRVVLRGDK